MLALAADISIRIVAAAAAVGLLLVVLRVRSGAARHAAWSAVLVTMLTMPALLAVVPQVDVPVPSGLAPSFEAFAGETAPYRSADIPASLQSAGRFPIEREQLLKDASRIRAGTMPLAYQFAEARR